ncbi:zincin-like metallopeptidase domain-containing protein [Magnetospirillum molischianum]|uniref:Protein (Antirestriction protein) n=1 Tax=Magnetospirillum molischianum DSM 120 TaxID=1150626 RepID=H8FVU4_MAGML|nr:zincin-like metallopeptidase domain-containing protein [Magnetospirillum molischianum]CCG42482.1 Protein (Antirestriction protein) [Magnetospirillum molischianum DSM 120]
MMAEPKISYRDEIAGEIIRRIEDGTAPWQKPWKAGEIGAAPFNPVSNKPYRGINDLWLSMMGRADPRWMTYRQALEIGAQVRKGERSTTVEYWQWSTREALIDTDGKPVLGEDGKPKMVETKLDRPRVFLAKVFNADQIDGLAPWGSPAPSFDPVAQAESLIDGAGIPVHHDQANRAFYTPGRDEIHLPPRGAFVGQEAYYATLLHELGHATGHPSRLVRNFGPFGSELYAREELRAEIASTMLARDLGISHDPANHAAYVESWLKALRDDKNEIFRAARDAETIKTWVMEPERRPELERAAQAHAAAKEQGMASTPDSRPDTVTERQAETRTYLAVPYAEKDQAKAAGAKWDRKAKSWYVPDGIDLAAFARWSGKPAAPAASLSPVEEFAEACKSHGLMLKSAPVMDGTWHRVPVQGDRKGQISGSYRGFLDGRPSGQITNYKAGGTVKWVATGQALTDEARAQVQAEAAAIRAERESLRLAAAEKAARVAYGVWENLAGAATPERSPYLAAKGVQGHGVRVDGEGKLMIPARDGEGKLWTLQVVGADGKRFLKQSHKAGTFHVIEPTGTGTLDTLFANPGPVLIAEGYATAASIFEATGQPVIAAFDSGNLAPVAATVRARYPDRTIVIAADDDHANRHGNVGLEKATEAAQAVGGFVVSPRFTAEEKLKGLTDFNDLAQSRGPGAVRQAIDSALARLREPSRSIA